MLNLIKTLFLSRHNLLTRTKDRAVIQIILST